ncbi:MAG: PH domain-containing protein [Flavobacterium sp.]|nr:PH domain-containing protein [Flavobacterium sp.]
METNFNTPQRQSSIGIFVLFFDSFQKLGRAFWPIILIWAFNSHTVGKVLIFFISMGVLSIIGTIAYLRYLNFTFYIDEQNDEFIVNEGIINKTKTTIQLNKIQQVSIHQNLIQRLIGVYAITIDTAGTDKKEGNIKAISHNLAVALKAKLLENENNSSATNIISSSDEALSENIPFLNINLLSLIKIGFTSNYVKSIGLILTFLITGINNLREIHKENIINGDKIQSFFSNYRVIYGILIFIAFIFIIVFIINLGRTLLKYFGYTISKQKGSLLLSYGLISTQSTILKPEKVQIVTVVQNYFQKKLDVLEIKIKQAISDEKQQSKSQIEIPGCNLAEKDVILNLIFKQLPKKGEMLIPNFRKLGFSIFLLIALPYFVFFLIGNYADASLFEYNLVALFYSIFVLIILIFGFRNYRIFINDSFIIKQSGAWDIKNEIIEIKKIQALTTSQLFWHKNLNIGTITMHTAGGNISFFLGNYAKIQSYVNLWLYEIEISDSNWM